MARLTRIEQSFLKSLPVLLGHTPKFVSRSGEELVVRFDSFPTFKMPIAEGAFKGLDYLFTSNYFEIILSFVDYPVMSIWESVDSLNAYGEEYGYVFSVESREDCIYVSSSDDEEEGFLTDAFVLVEEHDGVKSDVAFYEDYRDALDEPHSVEDEKVFEFIKRNLLD